MRRQRTRRTAPGPLPARQLYRLRIRGGWPPWRRARAIVRSVGMVADIDRVPGGWEARLRSSPHLGDSACNSPVGVTAAMSWRRLRRKLRKRLDKEGPWWAGSSRGTRPVIGLSGPEHYREAEKFADASVYAYQRWAETEDDSDLESAKWHQAQGLLHATLANAAAAALNRTSPDGSYYPQEEEAWHQAAGIKDQAATAAGEDKPNGQ